MAYGYVNSDFENISGSSSVYTFPSGAPAAGQLDIVTIAVVGSAPAGPPSGWSAGSSRLDTGFPLSVNTYYRFALGTEGSAVTLPNTAGGQVCWSRWAGAAARDTGGQAGYGTSNATQAVSTPALAHSGELSVAHVWAIDFGGSGVMTSPVWSAGYTGELVSVLNAGTHGGLVAYNPSAGTAAETPSVTWTGVMNDSVITVDTFTPAAAAGAAYPFPVITRYGGLH